MPARPSVAGSAIAGLGILGGLVVMNIVPTLAWVLTDGGFRQSPGEYVRLILLNDLGLMVGPYLVLAIVCGALFAAAVRGGLRAGRVLVRIIGTMLLAVVIAALLAAIVTPGLVLPYAPLAPGPEVLLSFASFVVRLFVDSAFLVPLAGLLLWVRLAPRGVEALPPAPPIAHASA